MEDEHWNNNTDGNNNDEDDQEIYTEALFDDLTKKIEFLKDQNTILSANIAQDKQNNLTLTVFI